MVDIGHTVGEKVRVSRREQNYDPNPSEVSLFFVVDIFKQTWRQFLSVRVTKVKSTTFLPSPKQTRFYADTWSHPAVVAKCHVAYVTAVSQFLSCTFLHYSVSLMTFVQDRETMWLQCTSVQVLYYVTTMHFSPGTVPKPCSQWLHPPHFNTSLLLRPNMAHATAR